jgi:uroporphyrinogen decarboxylase
MVHKYGAKVMMHSCGSVYQLIGTLIELGLDILDVVQVDCKNMDILALQKQFGGRLCFSGSISVQSTLPFGTPKDVEREVALRKELFPKGGLIFAPTHNIQVGTPMENIVAMYQAIGSFQLQ